MRVFAGNAHISIEGAYAPYCRLTQLPEASPFETRLLKRNTIQPVLDFIVLPLRPDMIDPILFEAARAGLRRNIIHVQIERDGGLVFGAFDNFHADCVSVSSALSTEMLDRLISEGVLRSYLRAEKDGRDRSESRGSS